MSVALRFMLCVRWQALTLTAVFIPDESGWTMAQLADWPAVGKPRAARDLPPTRRTTPDGC